MPLGIQNSFRGGLNLDDEVFSMRPDSYVDALNITTDAIERNSDYAATNVAGNRLVSYDLPEGTCQVIGAKEDLIRKRVIYFVWNSNDNHVILEYRNTTRTIHKILENLTDTDDVDILEFNRFKKIIHIEIVHREEGDLLYWTDGNVSPKGLIIDKVQDGDYGDVELDFITAAKSPPLQPAVVSYGNDSTRSTNGLRKKLYQLRYRWKYDDFSRSTWSPWSDVPLPIDLVGTDNDNDPTKNNYIATTITTGKKNVTDIEVGFRELGSTTWGDMMQTVSLNKEALSISDEVDYQYNFYNDNTPTLLDTRESLLLFDYFPLLAKSMVLANGNVLVYGAITEGYDNIPQNELDVEMTVEMTKNTGIDLGPPSLTYEGGPNQYNIIVGQTVYTGAIYRVITFITGGVGVITLSEYTSLPGDSSLDVAQGLFNSTSPTYSTLVSGSQYGVILPTGSTFIQVIILGGTSVGSVASGTGWLWGARYRFGLVYFDSKGRTNGVQTFVNQPADDGDFEVEIGDFELDGNTPKTGVINAEINHLPPSWAVKYCWVRTVNRTYDRFFQYVTVDFQSDAEYYYFGLSNVQRFDELNSKFIYPSIDAIVNPERGDRIRVVATADVSGYLTDVTDNNDFEILGIVERVPTLGGDDQKYVKIKKPISAPSPAYGINMVVFIYTPITNNAAQDKTVYFEFDQFYDIVDGFHMGQLQDQTGSQPATFQFVNGDFYYRSRTQYVRITGGELETQLLIMDANYSDFFPSAVNGNGRAEVVEVNAKQTYYPATVRFGQEFEPNTTINNLNRFYPGNFKDYNRVFGGILKMWIINQYLFIGQELKIGSVPILLQIVKTVDQTGQLTASDELLNTVQYYIDQVGVGDCPEAVAYFNWSAYGIDNRRGLIWRWSNNGIHIISVLYKVNSWASVELPLRDGSTTFCYGAFDQKLNDYILAAEATDDSESQTITFVEGNDGAEDRPCFGSFMSYKPEMMVTLGNLLITFKNGELWTHDSTRYNSFYGVDYESHISPVFSKPGLEKKGWQSLTQVSNVTWDAPLIYTNSNSQAAQRQETNLVEREFIVYEGNPTASIKRDANSRGGKVNGSFMKGNYIVVKLRKQDASDLIYLNLCSVKFVDSPVTAQ